jgi:hypothetical protein
MCPWRSAMEEDPGESTAIRLAPRVSTGAFPERATCSFRIVRAGDVPSQICQDSAVYSECVPARPRLETAGFCSKDNPDGCVALALLNFRRMGRPLTCSSGEPNRLGF